MAQQSYTFKLNLFTGDYVSYIYGDQDIFINTFKEFMYRQSFSNQPGNRYDKLIHLANVSVTDNKFYTDQIINLMCLIQQKIYYNYVHDAEHGILLVASQDDSFYFLEDYAITLDEAGEHSYWSGSDPEIHSKSKSQWIFDFNLVDFTKLFNMIENFCSTIGISLVWSNIKNTKMDACWQFKVCNNDYHLTPEYNPLDFLGSYPSKRFTDFTIETSSSKLCAHQIILSIWGGDYLKQLLSSTFQETQTNYLNLKQFSNSTVNLYLILVYGGDFFDFDDDLDIIELYRLSHYLLNQRITNLCLIYLQRTAKIDDITTITELNETYQDKELTNIVDRLVVIQKNLLR